jgi:hypothetical protein
MVGNGWFSGRKTTDVLFAALNCVVIFGSATARGFGSVILLSIGQKHTLWMPLVVAAGDCFVQF